MRLFHHLCKIYGSKLWFDQWQSEIFKCTEISSKVLEPAFSKHEYKAMYEKDKPKGFAFNISRL